MVAGPGSAENSDDDDDEMMELLCNGSSLPSRSPRRSSTPRPLPRRRVHTCAYLRVGNSVYTCNTPFLPSPENCTIALRVHPTHTASSSSPPRPQPAAGRLPWSTTGKNQTITSPPATERSPPQRKRKKNKHQHSTSQHVRILRVKNVHVTCTLTCTRGVYYRAR